MDNAKIASLTIALITFCFASGGGKQATGKTQRLQKALSLDYWRIQFQTLPSERVSAAAVSFHRCLPYCKPDEGEDTELAYTSENDTEETIKRAFDHCRDVEVTRAAIEPDAPSKMDGTGEHASCEGVGHPLGPLDAHDPCGSSAHFATFSTGVLVSFYRHSNR